MLEPLAAIYLHLDPDDLEDADAAILSRYATSIQLERQDRFFLPSLREYAQAFGITPERLARAGHPITVMHPGPINRGVEISADVADGEHSVILQQVLNGVAVRMAILYLLGTGN